ncbi:alpha/beta hydrolase [Aggregatilinea lenta]|uniref:alpha/beta hydrolase n=1 Tax=Aggregatilinea lenta TaxID=913108 RepID=UPI0013C36D14|nr:alpha/beta hydrolase [Aggregatilinea lenta]
MKHESGTFEGVGGQVIFTQHWLPDRAPRAVVMLAHGIAEHSGRYEHVARHLVEGRYAVYALDHRGHGKSEGERVMVGAFEDYVTDLRSYFEQVRATQPDLPVFLYGHSMGSLIALLFAAQYQDDLAGLITTGTALVLPGANRVMVTLVNLLDRAIPGVRLIPFDAEDVSRDPAVVSAYVNDPLVNRRRFKVHMIAELTGASLKARRALKSLRLPYLALHGGADRSCLPEGADIIRETCSTPDLTVKVYDGLYHEVHNEPEQVQVLDDIVRWLDAHATVRA